VGYDRPPWHLESEITAKGFVLSGVDPALWVSLGGGGAVLSMFYVDDTLVQRVASIFAIRALGEPDVFIGVEIARDREPSGYAKALALANAFAGQRKSLPMSLEILFTERRKKRPASRKQSQATGNIRRASGSVQRQRHGRQGGLSIWHRELTVHGAVRAPRHSTACRDLATYCSAPSVVLVAAMLDVVRCVGSTASRGITFEHTAEPVEVLCDANFAACEDTCRSTTGWVRDAYGGAVL
jgi:hypothetical protein